MENYIELLGSVDDKDLEDRLKKILCKSDFNKATKVVYYLGYFSLTEFIKLNFNDFLKLYSNPNNFQNTKLYTHLEKLVFDVKNAKMYDFRPIYKYIYVYINLNVFKKISSQCFTEILCVQKKYDNAKFILDYEKRINSYSKLITGKKNIKDNERITGMDEMFSYYKPVDVSKPNIPIFLIGKRNDLLNDFILSLENHRIITNIDAFKFLFYPNSEIKEEKLNYNWNFPIGALVYLFECMIFMKMIDPLEISYLNKKLCIFKVEHVNDNYSSIKKEKSLIENEKDLKEYALKRKNKIYMEIYQITIYHFLNK